MAQNRLVFRADSSADWAAANPILAVGEPGLAVDTMTLKIGDGSTPWVTLPAYTVDGAGAAIDDTQSDISLPGNTTSTLSSQAIHSLANQIITICNAYTDAATQQAGSSKWVPLFQNADGSWPTSTAGSQDGTLAVGTVGLGNAPTLPKATDLVVLKDAS